MIDISNPTSRNYEVFVSKIVRPGCRFKVTMATFTNVKKYFVSEVGLKYADGTLIVKREMKQKSGK